MLVVLGCGGVGGSVVLVVSSAVALCDRQVVDGAENGAK